MLSQKENINKISAILLATGIIVSLAFVIFSTFTNQLPTTIEITDILLNKCLTTAFLTVTVILLLQIIILNLKNKQLILNNLPIAIGFVLFWIFAATTTLFGSAFFNSNIISLISYQLPMLLFIPYISIIYNMTESKGLLVLVAIIILLLNLIIQNIINLTGIFYFDQMVKITGSLNVLCLLFGFYLTLENKTEKNTVYNFLGIGSLAFAVLYILEIIADTENQIFYMLGFLFLLIAIYCFAVKQKTIQIENETKEQIMRDHAMIDYQTGHGSRLAFDKYYYCLDNYYSGTVNISVLVIDLNNLKETNDTYGNPVGDELIKDTAKCIDEVFGEKTKCFRTGGDEFAVLAVNTSLDMESLTNIMDSKIIEYNTKHVHTLSIARGFCIDQADVKDTQKLRLIYKAADDRMYDDKIKKHEAMKVQMIKEKYLKKQMLQEQMIREKQFQEQMKKVAEAKKAEDLKLQKITETQESETKEVKKIIDETKDFWGEKPKEKGFFGKKNLKKKQITDKKEINDQEEINNEKKQHPENTPDTTSELNSQPENNKSSKVQNNISEQNDIDKNEQNQDKELN